MAIPIYPKQVFETLKSYELIQLLKPYSFNPETVAISPMIGGLRDACYLVKSENKSAVLRIYQPTTRLTKGKCRTAFDAQFSATDYQLPTTNYLRRCGFSVPRVIPTRDGELSQYYNLHGARRRVALFSYIQGVTLPRYLPRHLYAAGRTLSDLHAVLSLRDRPLPEGLSLSRTVLFKQNTILHGDFARGNLLFWHGRPSGIIDWAGATVGPAIYDLARSLALFFLDHPDRREADIRRDFLSGYNEGRNPLPDLADLQELEEVNLKNVGCKM